MPHEKIVSITKFNVVGKDDRGFTAEFSLPRSQDKFIFLTRKQGSLSGNTYHEGKRKGTSPKIFIVAAGKIALHYRKIGVSTHHQDIVEAPAMIEIHPYTTHKIEALSDCMLFECNSLEDIQNDRIREEV